jgi:hypothetical protein
MFKLNSNYLKIIAIIAMIIDHIGYYFYYLIDSNLYLIFRIIGRISMPIFVFLIVQGFLNTKNIKKYFLRIFILGIITQFIIIFLNYLNIKYVNTNIVPINYDLNILFSFSLLLIILYSMKKIINYKSLVYLIPVIISLLVYYFLSIDYGYLVPVLGVFLYIIINYLSRDIIIKSVFIVILFVFASTLSYDIQKFMIFSVPFILLYRNENVKNYKMIFYYIYPIQYVILYSVSLYISIIQT